MNHSVSRRVSALVLILAILGGPLSAVSAAGVCSMSAPADMSPGCCCPPTECPAPVSGDEAAWQKTCCEFRAGSPATPAPATPAPAPVTVTAPLPTPATTAALAPPAPALEAAPAELPAPRAVARAQLGIYLL